MLKSISPLLRWPAVIDPGVALVYGLHSQLMRTQWLDATTLRQMQAIQLSARLMHAAQASVHFRGLLGSQRIAPKDAFRALADLPLLKRGELQEKPEALFCEVDGAHGAVSEKRTTGSTGQPVTVRCSEAAFALREALTLRSYAWFGVELAKSFAAIRAGIATGKVQGIIRPTWGGTLARLFKTGQSFGLDLCEPVTNQVAWLQKHQPAYLLTYPSNLRVLMEAMPTPWTGLTGVMCVGESVSDDLRADLMTYWHVPLFDQYSSEELGSIAAQCEHGSFHIMAESVHVEVLRDDGGVCEPGEVGRVVATDMYNFATAMLRYELRDYAEVGAACPCGRGLPTLKRVLGRTRNRLVLPDGTRVWPSSGLRHFSALPIRQYQLIQLSVDRLEVRLHVARPLTDAEQRAISERIQASLGHPFGIELVTFDEPLPMGPGGKFEQFICMIE